MELPKQRRGSPDGRTSPRLINVSLGIWLFISAFLWPDARAQATNTWVCGVLCVAFAFAGMGLPWARHLNSALAVWLFVSTWALPTAHAATLWNNVLCAIAIFVVSLVPSDTTSLPGGLGRLARSN
jgi:SPW repeat